MRSSATSIFGVIKILILINDISPIKNIISAKIIVLSIEKLTAKLQDINFFLLLFVVWICYIIVYIFIKIKEIKIIINLKKIFLHIYIKYIIVILIPEK